MPDMLNRMERSALMSRIRSKWTLQEIEFKLENPKAERGEWLPHRPDFTLKGNLVWLDSDFWHCQLPKRAYERMKAFWREKLFRNLVRDMARNSFIVALEAVSSQEGAK